MAWTNWIIVSNEMVSQGDRVELMDGRLGQIMRVDPSRGLPVVRMDDATEEAVHPARIKRRAE